MNMSEMVIHQVTQGSGDWHALRASHFNASEAAAALGASKHQSRTALLQQKKTGIAPEVDEHTQRRFDAGHETEAKARAIVEKMIGEDLFPIVATRSVEGLSLLASVDGMNLLGDTLFEHKLYNADLAERVRGKSLEPHYYWQMEQQLLVTGADRVIFVTSDGTMDNFEWMEYRSVSTRPALLIAGWSQFQKDLEAFVPTVEAPAVIAAPVSELPAIRYELNGLALRSNIAEYRVAAEQLVEDSKKELQTDQDFADAEARIKVFGEAESKIKLVCEQVVGEIKDVDKFVRDLGGIADLIRQARLNHEKQVKSRKESIKLEITTAAANELREHIAAIEARVNLKLPATTADFAGAIKGKRTVASLRDAANTELARAKIEASQMGDHIADNLALLRERASEHKFLFADVQQIVLKSREDLGNLITLRINEHESELARRKEEEQRQQQQQEAAAAAAPVAITPAETAAAARVIEQELPELASIATPAAIAPAKVYPAATTRPSDQEIINAVAKAFSVEVSIASYWISQMKLRAA